VECADGIEKWSARRDITAIAKGTFADPFSILGVHPDGKGFVARPLFQAQTA
jgi:hypothetical protein